LETGGGKDGGGSRLLNPLHPHPPPPLFTEIIKSLLKHSHIYFNIAVLTAEERYYFQKKYLIIPCGSKANFSSECSIS